MSVFDIEGEPGKWFELDDGGRIQLRLLNADDFKAIRKQTVKKRVDFKKVDGTPSRFEHEENNEELQGELFWDSVIVNWEKFFDAKGVEIPCTKENKLLLMARSMKFVKIATDFIKVLNEDEEKQAGTSEKN
jgi:hypothetical protein